MVTAGDGRPTARSRAGGRAGMSAGAACVRRTVASPGDGALGGLAGSRATRASAMSIDIRHASCERIGANRGRRHPAIARRPGPPSWAATVGGRPPNEDCSLAASIRSTARRPLVDRVKKNLSNSLRGRGCRLLSYRNRKPLDSTRPGSAQDTTRRSGTSIMTRRWGTWPSSRVRATAAGLVACVQPGLVALAVACVISRAASRRAARRPRPSRRRPRRRRPRRPTSAIIKLKPEEEARLGVVLAEAERKPVPRTTTYGGIVEVPNGGLIVVASPFNGTLKAPRARARASCRRATRSRRGRRSSP